MGEGATATVYRGYFKEDDKTKSKDAKPKRVPVAVKCIRISKVKEKNLEKFLNQEYSVLNRVRHKNIVHFKGFEKSKNALYFVFELCEGGDL